MTVKTKKYQLPKNTYIKLALIDVLIAKWFWIGVPVAISAFTFFYPETIWFYIIAGILTIGFALFWGVQFVGVTQMEQNKLLFEKLSYEIDGRHLMIKLNAKQGMPVKWDQIQGAKKGKDYYLITISRAHVIHLPFKVFNNENDIKFVETLFKRKGLLK